MTHTPVDVTTDSPVPELTGSERDPDTLTGRTVTATYRRRALVEGHFDDVTIATSVVLVLDDGTHCSFSLDDGDVMLRGAVTASADCSGCSERIHHVEEDGQSRWVSAGGDDDCSHPRG